jgi:hypothetical protein
MSNSTGYKLKANANANLSDSMNKNLESSTNLWGSDSKNAIKKTPNGKEDIFSTEIKFPKNNNLLNPFSSPKDKKFERQISMNISSSNNNSKQNSISKFVNNDNNSESDKTPSKEVNIKKEIIKQYDLI